MPGAEQVKRNMREWLNRKLAAEQALGDYYAGKMEGEAKLEAPWTDRTGAARKGLFGESKIFSDFLRVRLAHVVDYGPYLELAMQRKYAILEPVVQRNAPQFFRDAEEVLRG